MIHFALPWLLGAGVVAAAVITTLHFLSVRRPPELLLPTARFLDEGRVRAVSRSAQPSDLPLLMLRILALLLASAAFATPQWVSRSHRVARLIVADVSMRADSAALMKRARAKSSGETLTRFVWMDSVDALGQPSGMRAEFAAALPSAVRAATLLSAEMLDVDSVELYVVAPSGEDGKSESWGVWRGEWPGAVHVLLPALPAARQTLTLRYESAGADDVLRSAFATRATGLAVTALANGMQSGSRDVIVRRAASAVVATADASSGAVTIVWPEDGVPRGWQSVHDTVGAVAANGVALVASWVRASTPSSTSMRGARAIAWWSDGAVAAVERAQGRGCVREVGIVVPPSSDLLLDANADGVMSALTAPCAGAPGGAATLSPVTATPAAVMLADSLDTASGAAAAASHFRTIAGASTRSSPSWLSALLLVVALVLLVIEWVLRDRGAADRGDDALSSGGGGERVGVPS